MFEFARNPISHQTKITISNTPTMTKNDSSAAAVAQSSALLPPRINANTPSGRDPAISPAVSLPMRPSARPFPTGRFPPGRRADQQATSCFVCPPPKLQAPPHSSHRLISIVSSRGDKGKVRNCLVGFVFQSKLTFLFINFPASAVTPRIFGFWSSGRPSTPRPDRYRWYRSATKAKR